MTGIDETDALKRLKNYCSVAEHCRAEVTEKMQRWGIDYKAIDRIVNQLVEEKYIDEVRYCRAFVNDKYRLEKWGRVKIGQALQLKKISSAVYWPILNEIDKEEYRAILKKLLDSKRKSIHAASEQEQKDKLIRFALSRGYDMEDIRFCMELPDDAE